MDTPVVKVITGIRRSGKLVFFGANSKFDFEKRRQQGSDSCLEF